VGQNPQLPYDSGAAIRVARDDVLSLLNEERFGTPESSNHRVARATNVIWVVVSIFNFHPYLGKIPILTNILQMD